MNSGSIIGIVLLVGLVVLTIYLTIGLVKDIKLLVKKKKEEKNKNASNGSADEQITEENK